MRPGEVAQNLRCFELNGPLLSEKQNLVQENQNVWGCQGMGMSRMGYNLLWVQLELEERLLHPSWSRKAEQRDHDRNTRTISPGKKQLWVGAMLEGNSFEEL
ncbi:hypothetical protein TURU_096419 [Turdus rufiventris]|nr:hypothetical protein TURU_096419 [Turdus rufiventris]